MGDTRLESSFKAKNGGESVWNEKKRVLKQALLNRIVSVLDHDNSGDLDRVEIRELIASVDPRDKTIGPIFKDVRSFMERAGVYSAMGKLKIKEIEKAFGGMTVFQLDYLLRLATAYKNSKKLKNQGMTIWILPVNTLHKAEEYHMRELIGEEGGFGAVFRAIRKKDRHEVAIKRMCKYMMYESKALLSCRKEIELMRQAEHPNVIKLYDAYEDERYLFVVMEILKGGELFDRLDDYMCNEELASSVAAQILQGISHLHARGIAHCDVKPENFLFRIKERRFEEMTKSYRTLEKFRAFHPQEWKEQWNQAEIEKSNIDPNALVLIDFGISHRLNSFGAKIKGRKGTILFMAPEVVDGEYNYHCDMWSIGIVLFVMLYGHYPFNFKADDCEMKDHAYVFSQIKKGFQPVLKPGRGPWFNSDVPVSKEARDLIAALLTTDVVERATASDALLFPWFKKTKEASSARKKMIEESLHQISDMSSFRELMLALVVEGHSRFLGPLQKIVDRKLEKKGSKSKISISEVVELFCNAPGSPVSQKRSLSFSSKRSSRRPSRFEQKKSSASVGKECEESSISMSKLKLLVANCTFLAKEERLSRLFNQLDYMDEGKITFEGFCQAVRSCGFGVSRNKLKEAFSSVCAEDEQEITYDRFLRIFGITNFGSMFRARSRQQMSKSPSLREKRKVECLRALSSQEFFPYISVVEETKGVSTMKDNRNACGRSKNGEAALVERRKTIDLYSLDDSSTDSGDDLVTVGTAALGTKKEETVCDTCMSHPALCTVL